MAVQAPAQTWELGADLARLVESVGEPVDSVRQITGLRAAARERATFRIRFQSGRVLKGRRMDTVVDAERAFRLGGLLNSAGFTRPSARDGVALLEPWVAGTRLDRAHPDAHLMAECGRLLGSVHALRVDTDGENGGWNGPARLANVEFRLGRLRDLSLLPRRTHVRLVGMARETAPREVHVGLIHRDLWPRNVVVDRRRCVHVIDNASLRIGAHGFDWARTAYLWHMSRDHAEAFRAGYVSAAPRPADESPFWMIDVLSDVALFRRLAAARGVSRPVARLRELAVDS